MRPLKSLAFSATVLAITFVGIYTVEQGLADWKPGDAGTLLAMALVLAAPLTLVTEVMRAFSRAPA